jgi:hypothetical protein
MLSQELIFTLRLGASRRGKENLNMRVEKIDILEPINREFALKWDVDVLVNNLPGIADSKLLFIMTL